MKKLAVALILLQPATIFAATDKPNPADYTVTVHVISSATQQQFANGLLSNLQVLEAVIDNESMELQTSNGGLLEPGDYKARLSTSVHGPKNAHSYDIYRGYDLLMPDGAARTYRVTRLGPASTNP